MPITTRQLLKFSGRYMHEANYYNISTFYVENMRLPGLQDDIIINSIHLATPATPAQIVAAYSALLSYNTSTKKFTALTLLYLNPSAQNALGFNKDDMDSGEESTYPVENIPIGVLYYNNDPLEVCSAQAATFYQEYALRADNRRYPFEVFIHDGDNIRPYFGDVYVQLVYGNFTKNFRKAVVLTKSVQLDYYTHYTLKAYYTHFTDDSLTPLPRFPIVRYTNTASHSWVEKADTRELTVRDGEVALVLFR